METKGQRVRHALITAWTLAVIVFLYLPTVCITIASFTASRYFQFPIAKFGLDWWDKTFNSIEIRQLLSDLDQHRPVRDRHRRDARLLRRAGLCALRLEGALHLPEAHPAADLLSAIGAGPCPAALVQHAGIAAVLDDRGFRPSRLDRARS